MIRVYFELTRCAINANQEDEYRLKYLRPPFIPYGSAFFCPHGKIPQSRIVPSQDPDAISVPSGEKTTVRTESVCAFNVRSISPSEVRHKSKPPFSFPLRRRDPSGEKWMLFAWLFKFPWRFRSTPAEKFQRAIEPPEEHDARSNSAGEKAKHLALISKV